MIMIIPQEKNDWIKEYKIFRVSNNVFQKGYTSFHSNHHQHSLTVSLLTMTITIFKSQCYFIGEEVCFDKMSFFHYKVESPSICSLKSDTYQSKSRRLKEELSHLLHFSNIISLVDSTTKNVWIKQHVSQIKNSLKFLEITK